MDKVKIYSTPTCPFCHRAKAYLTERGIEFEDHDVSSDQEALAQMIDLSGQMGVPVIAVGDQVVVGFDRTKLEALLPPAKSKA